MSKLILRSTGPYGHTASLDGVDITHLVVASTVEVRAGNLPRVVLEPLVVELEVDTENTRVHLPADVADLLVALGWKPPAELGRNEVH